MYQEKLKIDWITIALYAAIMIFGWMNIYSACYEESHAAIFDFSQFHGKQLIWMGLALLTAAVIMLTEPRVFSNMSYPIYGIVLGLLVAIDIDLKDMRTKVISLILIAIPAVLVLLQHDTGSALVFASFIFPLYREGVSGVVLVIGVAAIALFIMALLVNKYIILGILALMAVGYLFVWLNKRSRKDYFRTLGIFACCALFVFSVDFVFNNVLESHQRERIDVLLGKTEDLQGSGYNVNQSKIAIGSGGIIGKGFLGGTVTKANFVPEKHTDFIFCTVGEEWGFLGCTILLILYNLLLQRLINMAERQRSPFARIYGYCVASILFIHLLVNVGMVIGLVPVIGIPLPFFSYGGSSLLAFTILLFIFIRQDASKNQLL